MKFEVLVPTMDKTKEDIKNLYHLLNIKSDALFANQCGKNEKYSFNINGCTIRVICTDTIGVSKNRNILLDNCNGDYCVCIDDDCALVDNYEVIITNNHKITNFTFGSFNGQYTQHNNKKVSNKKSGKINYFNQISYAGAPGFVFNRKELKKLEIKYRENLGVPNEICAGEDTMFYCDLVKKNTKSFYRFSEVLFKILNNDTESSYFNGIDYRYVKTRGYVTNLLHPHIFPLYMIRHVLRFKKQDKTNKLKTLFSWFLEGVKECKKR